MGKVVSDPITHKAPDASVTAPAGTYSSDTHMPPRQHEHVSFADSSFAIQHAISTMLFSFKANFGVFVEDYWIDLDNRTIWILLRVPGDSSEVIPGTDRRAVGSDVVQYFRLQLVEAIQAERSRQAMIFDLPKIETSYIVNELDRFFRYREEVIS